MFCQETQKTTTPLGRCCQTGCPDCPYGYTQEKKIDPSYPAELQVEDERSEEDFFTDYDEED